MLSTDGGQQRPAQALRTWNLCVMKREARGRTGERTSRRDLGTHNQGIGGMLEEAQSGWAMTACEVLGVGRDQSVCIEISREP